MNKNTIKDGYILVHNFIDMNKAIELGKEFKEYVEKNNLSGDSQVNDSYCCLNYISFLELLCDKTSEVSSLIGETVLPTYTYARVYKKSNILERHIDRNACEVSLTVHFYGDQSWKFYIKANDGEIKEIILNPGDALLYFGCENEHWRNEYEGEYYVQCFLHYVKSRGNNHNCYFDRNNKFKDNYELKEYIKIYENIVPNNLCDEILNEYEMDDWDDAVVGNDFTVNKKARNCKIIPISLQNVISKNYQKRKNLDDLLFKCAENAIKQYNQDFKNLKISADSGYDLLKYEIGGYYCQHTDSFEKQQRSISCSFCLNDDYEGGEFAFFDRNCIFKPKKGSVIMFPSNFMFPHEIMPIKSGVRYSIITWFV